MGDLETGVPLAVRVSLANRPRETVCMPFDGRGLEEKLGQRKLAWLTQLPGKHRSGQTWLLETDICLNTPFLPPASSSPSSSPPVAAVTTRPPTVSPILDAAPPFATD